MNVEDIITYALTFIVGGGGVTLLNAWWGRNRGLAQSENEARGQETNWFTAWREAQDEKIRQLNAEVATVKAEARAEISEVRAQVKEVRAEARSAEDYIDILIIGISDGTIPPIPPRLPHHPSE